MLRNLSITSLLPKHRCSPSVSSWELPHSTWSRQRIFFFQDTEQRILSHKKKQDKKNAILGHKETGQARQCHGSLLEQSLLTLTCYNGQLILFQNYLRHCQNGTRLAFKAMFCLDQIKQSKQSRTCQNTRFAQPSCQHGTTRYSWKSQQLHAIGKL